NNSDDKIILLDSLNRVIDSLQYFSRWGGSNGKSLERINSENSATDSSNWKTSISRLKATPGLINSVTKKNFDISVVDILFNPRFPIAGNNVSISASMKNIGKNNATFYLLLYEDTDLDSLPDLLIETTNQFSLNANDSGAFSFNYLIQNLQNERAFFVKSIFIEDQDTSNNYYYKKIQPGFEFNSIVINEIMFAPTGGEPEWIELYNKTNFQINLKGWKISDVITTPQSTEIKNDFIIKPKSYAVITKDTSIVNYHRIIPASILRLNFASLNNDIDGVVLRDNRGLTIDSVFYSNQWGGTNGFSLERISISAPSNTSSNWASSIDIEQSTPGRINSRTPKQNDLTASDLLFSPRFPTLGDNVSVSAKIKNFGSQRSSSFTVRFYIDSDSNNVVDQLIGTATGNNLESSDSLVISCPNRLNNLIKKTLVAAEISYNSDEDTLNNFIEKFIEPGFPEGLIKISELMFNPADGKPEWIEFFNNSNDSINIRNWSVSDILTTPTKGFLTNQNLYVKPKEYFIVTKDTSFNRFYPNVTAKIFYTNFGTLGNTSDGIIIYDFRNGIIDSLFYRSSWGNKKDVSLERISFQESTNDSTNWTLSLDRNGSTPGKENSINNAPTYQRNSVVINEIMFDPDIDNSEFIEFYNNSDDSVNIGGWFINDDNNNKFRLSNINYNLPPKSFFLLAADSTTISKYNLQSLENISIVGKSDLSLSNSGETVLLKDVRGRVIDSVKYSPKWHNKNFVSTKNISIERINPNFDSNDPMNWSSSVNQIGATPNKANSIFTINNNRQSNLSVSPNPFSPDNDGFEDFCIINYNLTQTISQVRIKIFDSKGRLVRTLLNNQPSGSSGSVIFDGKDEDGRALRIGIYVIFLEALNDNSGVVETEKTVVVIARKL
ncbi:MAG: lamin tail domain-containing protein, partial [Ignavibacterium sp.]|nr:lamin tail domain-containing protein [Ignavibacterium sp.]MDW8374213.1 lamin tail domain-containing protein [Ignavibacteriales bacterium]